VQQHTKTKTIRQWQEGNGKKAMARRQWRDGYGKKAIARRQRQEDNAEDKKANAKD
jgi:hypothetical protein